MPNCDKVQQDFCGCLLEQQAVRHSTFSDLSTALYSREVGPELTPHTELRNLRPVIALDNITSFIAEKFIYGCAQAVIYDAFDAFDDFLGSCV